jgi:hypothetical protein
VREQIFPSWADTVLRVGLGALALGGALFVVALFAWERSPFVAQTKDARMQPVKFDHRHHVRDDGIDCLYCHSGASSERFAGVPDSATCMGCHDQIWTDSPELAVVRDSVARDTPIVWNRVTNLPDHVFFNHGVHVTSGVACDTCHGRVDLMGQVYQVEPMTMSWCLGCHRSHGASTQCSACHR